MRGCSIASVLFLFVGVAAQAADDVITHAANGTPIRHPTSKQTVEAKAGEETIAVPTGMVLVPGGPCRIGDRRAEQTVDVPAFCMGKFHVTNAEYSAFLKANPAQRPPRYWKNGAVPEGKANHPVAWVSLHDARAYAKWISSETGWNIVIPTSLQWEKAARGPKGTLYPWGDAAEISYRDGVLHSRFNFNGVVAAEVLRTRPEDEVTYNNRKSTHFGEKTTVGKIVAYGDAERQTPFSISPNGSVRGWVSHDTYTGFIYTSLFSELSENGGYTTPVGQYEEGKSGYGCYDMAGNLWTWCETEITATNGAEKGKRVHEIRGGSWYATNRSCVSVAIGEGREARGAYNTVGFRIAMIPASSTPGSETAN